MNDASKYEFYAGTDPSGKPVWTNDFKKIRPGAITVWLCRRSHSISDIRFYAGEPGQDLLRIC
jgi:hypothetical protein